MNRKRASLTIVLSLIVNGGLLGAGIWMIRKGNLDQFKLDILAPSQSYFYGTSIFFIVVFALAFLAGLYCLWDMYRSGNSEKYLLVPYSWIMQFLLFAMLINGCVCWWFRSELQALNLGPNLTDTVTVKYGQPKHSGSTEGYDLLQQQLQCCGAVNGTSDWRGSQWAESQSEQIHVPDSCCVPPLDRQQCNMMAADTSMDNRDKYVYTEACATVLNSRLFTYMWGIFAATVLFFILQTGLSILLCTQLTADSKDNAFVPVGSCLIAASFLCRD